MLLLPLVLRSGAPSELPALLLKATTCLLGLLHPRTAAAPQGVVAVLLLLPPVEAEAVPAGCRVPAAALPLLQSPSMADRPAAAGLYCAGPRQLTGLSVMDDMAVDSCSPGAPAGADVAKRTRVNDPEGMRTTSMLPLPAPPLLLAVPVLRASLS